ncbi:MAG: DNA-binding GntR family transcriptional regulator [Planctomycetota bacterium]|jgi:DNA-binding GntR family transcriptional regulator
MYSMLNNLSEQAYGHIRQRLTRGEWQPGTRLVHRTLAAEMGISFTPVREAIQRLASEGLIKYQRGSGAFVHSPDRREMAELYELRLVLEPFAAQLAARHATSHELDDLDACCAGFRAIAADLRSNADLSVEQLDRWLDCEERFHRGVFEAARNRWLTKIAGDLSFTARTFQAQRGAVGLVTADVAGDTCVTHAQLVDRLRERDEIGAVEWMTTQIERGRDTVLSYIDKHQI